MDDRISVAENLARFSDHFAPRTVAQFNGHDAMVAKAAGEFTWHTHEETDDFVLVLAGRLTIEMPDRAVALGPGELFGVPRDVAHRPVAEEEAHILLIEPRGTPNTGDAATAAPRQVI